jgi:Bacterial extracellular solute-binding proteins, family 5 Middle
MDQNSTNPNFFVKIVNNLRLIRITDLTIFKRPKLVNMAFKSSSRLTKLFIVVQFGLLLATIILTGIGFYDLITIEVPNPNATINEAVVLNYKRFNPLFNPANSLEDRITKMLYAPLLQMKYESIDNLKGFAKPELVLLKSTPTSINADRSFLFTLRDDITWSNFEKITTDDIKFTFDLLKKLPNANNNFKTNFAELDIEIRSPQEFIVSSPNPRPNLFYEIGFSPIPKTRFKDIPEDKIFDSQETFAPTLTSGFYKLADKKIKDLDINNNKESQNPVVSQGGESMVYLALESNSSDNYPNIKIPNSKFWNIKKYDAITSKNLPRIYATTIESNVTKSTDSNKTSLFIRNLNEKGSLFESKEEIKDSLKLKQSLITNNWVLSGYFNINPTDDRIKETKKIKFRNYIACGLYQTNLDNISNFTSLPIDRRNLPLNTRVQLPSDCSEETKNLLQNPDYKLVDDKLKYANNPNPLSVNILYFGYEQDQTITRIKNKIQTDLKVDTVVVSKTNNEEYFTNIFSNSKELDKYDLIILPREVKSYDLNSEFNYNQTNILGSKRIKELDDLNALLPKYHSSSYNDENNVLTKYLNEQKLSIYFGRFQTEVNHTLIGKVSDILEEPNGKVEYKFPYWYTTPARDWWFKKKGS